MAGSLAEKGGELDFNRNERRYALSKSAEIEELLGRLQEGGYREIVYDNQWARTVYFGQPDGNFIRGAGLKFRKYFDGSLEAGAFAFPLVNCEGIFEIKRAGGNGDERKKEKVNIGFDELCNGLAEGNLPAGLKLEELGGQQPVIPVAVTQYRRRHFVSSDSQKRITLDQDTGLYKTVKGFDGKYYAVRLCKVSGTIVEVKSEIGSGSDGLDDWIKKHGIKAASKWMNMQYLYNWTGVNTRIVKPDEMIEGGVEKLLEREEKMRVVGSDEDVRELLNKIQLPAGTGMEFTDGITYRESWQRFVVINPERGICILGRPGNERGMKMKYKYPVGVFEGVMIREEAIAEINPEEMKKALTIMGGDTSEAENLCQTVLADDGHGSRMSPYRITPYFERKRIYRQLVVGDTGDIFFIIADDCVGEDHRPNLRQMEVEHYGRLTVREFDRQKYSQDILGVYKRVSDAVKEGFAQIGYSLVTDLRTKFEWISQLDN